MSDTNKLSETYERYALGLARTFSTRQVPDRQRNAFRRTARSSSALLDRLVSLGSRVARKDDLHGPPRGCVPCLQGRGSNVSLTTLCNRDCFFCFNPKPRTDDLTCTAAGRVGRRSRPHPRVPGPCQRGHQRREPLLFPTGPSPSSGRYGSVSRRPGSTSHQRGPADAGPRGQAAGTVSGSTSRPTPMTPARCAGAPLLP